MRGSSRVLMGYHSGVRKARKMLSEEAVAAQVEAAGRRGAAQRAASQAYLGSLGRVADHYEAVGASLGAKAKNELTNRLAEGKIRKDLHDKSWSRSSFASSTAAPLYLRYQHAFAKADLTALRDLCSPSMLSRAKLQLASRRSSHPLAWHGRVLDASVISVRFIPVDEMALNFAHIAVRLDTLQRAQLLSPDRKTVIHETEERNVTETWVFERVTNRPDGRWRWCGTLPLPEGEKSLIQMQEEQQAASKT